MSSDNNTVHNKLPALAYDILRTVNLLLELGFCSPDDVFMNSKADLFNSCCERVHILSPFRDNPQPESHNIDEEDEQRSTAEQSINTRSSTAHGVHDIVPERIQEEKEDDELIREYDETHGEYNEIANENSGNLEVHNQIDALTAIEFFASFFRQEDFLADAPAEFGLKFESRFEEFIAFAPRDVVRCLLFDVYPGYFSHFLRHTYGIPSSVCSMVLGFLKAEATKWYEKQD